MEKSTAPTIANIDSPGMCQPQNGEFTASAVGGKGFEKIDSAILASAKSLRFLNSDNVSFGESIPRR